MQHKYLCLPDEWNKLIHPSESKCSPQFLSWTSTLAVWPHRSLLLVKGSGRVAREEMNGLRVRVEGGYMGRVDTLMAVLVYLDHSRWRNQRGLQVLMCFRACHPKWMPSLIRWNGSAFLPRLCRAAKACCYFSILTGLSSFCGYINIDYVLTSLGVKR